MLGNVDFDSPDGRLDRLSQHVSPLRESTKHQIISTSIPSDSETIGLQGTVRELLHPPGAVLL